MFKYSGRSMATTTALLVSALTAGSAAAQDRFEANTRGNFGGYSTFGGYYDTFGGYGGKQAYGYRRYDQNYSSTSSFLAVPVLGPAETTDTCGWLRERARTTGARKWKARYAACRSGN